MHAILVIARRELAAVFQSPVAFIVLVAFVGLSGFLFFQSLFLVNQARMDGFFGLMPILFLFFGPAIAMRLLAEERGTGTVEMLLTMPVTDTQVVLGKFLGALALLALALVATFPFALSVAALGPLDWGPVIGGYLGAFLLGAAYVAIGLFASATTKNQIVAFIVGFAICFGLYLLGAAYDRAGEVVGPVLRHLSPQTHFERISRGVIELPGVVYYLSLIAVLLVLSIQVLDSRRWTVR